MTVRRRAAAYALTVALASLGVASGAAAPTLAQAQSKAAAKPKPKEMFPYWEHFMRIPAAERTRFQLAYYLSLDKKPLADVPLFAVDGARREAIAVGPEGRARPPALDFFRSKTAVMDGPVPAGRKVSVNMVLQATAAPARELDAAEMAATLTQANAGIRKAAGPIGMVAPKMGRTIFVSSKGGEAIAADGRRIPLPMTGDSAYYQPASMPAVRRLVLSQTPTRIALAPAVKSKS